MTDDRPLIRSSPSPSPSRSQRTTGLLRQLGGLLGDRYAEGLIRAGYRDLTASQTQLFPLIGAEGARLTEIAERARASKQALQVTVDQLEAAGYVERVADPLDRRAKLVRLTERGWTAFFAVNRIVDDIDRSLVAALGETRMRALQEIVGEAIAALQTRPSEVSAPPKHKEKR